MADPVAEKSGFLKMYMSNHPDTLVAYAKWYGKDQLKAESHVVSAEMTEIDTKKMTLTCSLKSGAKKVVVVPLDPPLRGYDDVKPRLLEMKSIAQENLGMIKTPRINSFTLPWQVVISSGLIGTLLYFTLGPRYSADAWFDLAKMVRGYPYAGLSLDVLGASIVVVHILETLYVASLCRKHTSFFVGTAYTFGVLFLGFPILTDFRRKIQQARIDSVMKVE